MARKINVKIDVKKLNKAKLFVGEKGTYANITLIESPGGKYGDWLVIEDLSKEEREAGKKDGTILGNGKNHGWTTDATDGGAVGTKVNQGASSDDIPF